MERPAGENQKGGCSHRQQVCYLGNLRRKRGESRKGWSTPQSATAINTRKGNIKNRGGVLSNMKITIYKRREMQGEPRKPPLLLVGRGEKVCLKDEQQWIKPKSREYQNPVNRLHW